jgi:hypothetical protein
MVGQLNPKSYRGLVCADVVKRDGTGGLISWGDTPRGIRNTNWPRYYPHSVSEFTASDGGSRLQLVPHASCTLLSLPSSIWSSISRDVVFPKDGVHTNVDIDTRFALGLPHVSKKLRADLWPTCL